MPHWNGRLDGGGTPAMLEGAERDAREIERRVAESARGKGCKLEVIVWSESPADWVATATISGDDEDAVKRVFADFGERNPRKIGLRSDEKKR